MLATAKTDERGYAKFDAAITKGEGGTAPAILVAEKGAGEYAFLDLTLNAFDLSDRGVKGRDPAGPIDAYVYTERGVYRGGDEVNITALVRDQFGKASAVPTTLIVSRPDGVEQTRLVMNDQGLGGRTLTVPLAKTAMTGTWRLWLHTDPKAPAIAERAFLVEDFVPERLDMKLSANVPVLTPDENQTINADGHYLYGPPAAGLGLEGEVVVKASNKDVAGLCRLFVRPGRRTRKSGAPAARSQSRDGQRRQGGDPRRAAGDAENTEATRSRDHRQAARVRRSHDRTQSDAAGRFETGTHRHQAAVRKLHGTRRPERRLRSRVARCER